MDYEKLYKEALNKAKSKIENDKGHVLYEDDIMEIFPELAENEDERISREITKFLVDYYNGEYERPNENTIDSWLSWLEKQGEQRSNNIKPKFKVGDWITNGDYTWKIVEVKPLDYILQSQDGNIVDDTISHVDTNFSL